MINPNLKTLTGTNALAFLIHYLDQLQMAHIDYQLQKVRDALMVVIAIPGERWEVEFFEDGHIEIEKFRSDGDIASDSTDLDTLIAGYLAEE
jgi:hypothetical protein